jgi:hypothetical protein
VPSIGTHRRKLAENPIELAEGIEACPTGGRWTWPFLNCSASATPPNAKNWCDELYYETANHFPANPHCRSPEAGTAGRNPKAASSARTSWPPILWDSLPPEDKQPLAAWLAAVVADGLAVNIPESDDCNLPEANDFLDASSVFFHLPGAEKKQAQKISLPSRAHAELVHLAWRQKILGNITLPKTEKAPRELYATVTARLQTFDTKAGELARSRTSDERKALDLSRLLAHWMIHGKPNRQAKQKEPDESAENSETNQ